MVNIIHFKVCNDMCVHIRPDNSVFFFNDIFFRWDKIVDLGR